MATDLIKKFQKNNTAYFQCYYRDQVSTLTDPTSPTYLITDINGATITSGTPTKKSTGLWYLFWEPTATGDFVITFGGTIDGDSVKIRRKFKVIETELV